MVFIVVYVETDAASMRMLDNAVDATVEEEVVLVLECVLDSAIDDMVGVRSEIGIGAEIESLEGDL